MNKRRKILAIGFAVVAGGAVLAKAVYPRWIAPLVTIDERIAERKKHLATLNEVETQVLAAKYAYRDYAARVGSMDPETVQNRIKARLDKLIEKNRLADANVSPPRRINKDRKTQLSQMTFSVSATGTLESTVKFLREAAELPFLLRISNPKLRPASTSRRDRDQDRMRLDGSIEVVVLPQQRILGDKKLMDRDLIQPVSYKRHLDRDYAKIWSAKPFTEHQRPKPTFKPQEERPERDKPEREKPKVRIRTTSKRWKNRERIQFCGFYGAHDGATSSRVAQLYDGHAKETRFVGVGEDFDGGSLLYVHQRGALVGREDGEFVYPIGKELDSPIRLRDATDYPELQQAWEKLQEADAASKKPAEDNEAKQEPPPGDEDPGGEPQGES
jgi:hypothetical protein